MHPIFASQFKKPKGIIGIIIANAMRRRNGFVYSYIEKFSDFNENMRVLEIGHGPGVGLNYYISKYKVIMEGIDFSKLMYDMACRRNKKHIKNGLLTLLNDDFLQYNFDIKKYDRIIFANVIYFWTDIRMAFGKIYTLLNQNGKLIFYMSSKNRLEKMPLTMSDLFNRYDSEYVENCLKECGFTDVSTNKIVDDSGDFLVVSASR